MARRPSNDTGTRPVSMADVARAAGVSQQTVSRVANGLPNVNEQTRQRVQAAMQELGFRPSYAGRSLRDGRYHSVGLCINDVTKFGNLSMIDGIASTAQKFNKGNDGMGSVGLIIGATIGQWINDSGVDPAKFTGPILSPGYGWQGAETRDLKTVFKGTKGNVLVTVSRSIATHGPDIAKLTEATASVARDIRQALTEAQNESADDAADGDVE